MNIFDDSSDVEVKEKKARVWSPLDDDEEVTRDRYAFYRKY